jgi:hypothetical protein
MFTPHKATNPDMVKRRLTNRANEDFQKLADTHLADGTEGRRVCHLDPTYSTITRVTQDLDVMGGTGRNGPSGKTVVNWSIQTDGDHVFLVRGGGYHMHFFFGVTEELHKADPRFSELVEDYESSCRIFEDSEGELHYLPPAKVGSSIADADGREVMYMNLLNCIQRTDDENRESVRIGFYADYGVGPRATQFQRDTREWLDGLLTNSHLATNLSNVLMGVTCIRKEEGIPLWFQMSYDMRLEVRSAEILAEQRRARTEVHERRPKRARPAEGALNVNSMFSRRSPSSSSGSEVDEESAPDDDVHADYRALVDRAERLEEVIQRVTYTNASQSEMITVLWDLLRSGEFPTLPPVSVVCFDHNKYTLLLITILFRLVASLGRSLPEGADPMMTLGWISTRPSTSLRGPRRLLHQRTPRSLLPITFE